MILKGFDKFREKTPMLKGHRIIIIPIYALLVIILTFIVLNLFYSFPHSSLNPLPTYFSVFVPFFGVLVLEIAGFFLVFQLWFWKNALKKRYGPTSYQKIFLIGFAGIIIVISLAFNVFSSVQSYSPLFWQMNENSFLVKPFYFLFETNLSSLIHSSQIILGIFFLLLGLSISMRSVLIFGFDYTTVVYLYFPEESEIKVNQIYSVVRHPMYSGIIIVAFGGFLYNLTIYSLFLFMLYIIGFYLHIHFVEEPELQERFGESFISYKKSVPPFFINPVKFPKLIKFIVKG